MIPVVIGSTFLVYVVVFATGDPSRSRCGERPCSPEYVAKFRETYNLDEPLLVQYALYWGKLLRGDFGTTFFGTPVATELINRFDITIRLALIALAFEIVIGIAAGVLAGLRKGSFFDNLVLVSTLFIIAIPIFVVGSVLQLIFGVKLGWFPVTSVNGTWNELILPGFVLGAVSIALVARLTRATLSETLRADYVRTAKAKGLTTRRVITVHALRNALIPVVTAIGIDVGALMGGAIVTENIFNVQGVGFFLFRSILTKDGQAVVGTIVCLVLVYLLVNLLVDLLYGLLDPRIAHD